MCSVPQLILTSARRFELSAWLRSQLEDLCAQDIGAVRGPVELAVSGIAPDVVFTNEAWPHTDPRWAGRVFFTMTVDGGMYQFGSLSQPDGRLVPAGMVFRVNPLELHWLRPDPVVSTGWVALQWDVPAESAETFELELAAAIRAWSEPAFTLPKLGYLLE